MAIVLKLSPLRILYSLVVAGAAGVVAAPGASAAGTGLVTAGVVEAGGALVGSEQGESGPELWALAHFLG